MLCITLHQQNTDTKYFGQEVRGGALQYCRIGAESEVFSRQDPVISPTMLMTVILKESNLN
jgi:hypothetical protein